MSNPDETFRLMLSIISSGKNQCITETARQEVLRDTGIDVADFGISVVADMPSAKPSGEDRVLACVAYADGDELILPDNKTCECGWGCGRTVQHRPEHPDWLTKVCLHCIDARPKDNHS